LFLLNAKKIVVDNAVFRLSIASPVPEIFAIKIYSCVRNLDCTINNSGAAMLSLI